MHPVLLLITSLVLLLGGFSWGGEPTNAAEAAALQAAAAKKNADQQAIDSAYAVWKAGLSPARQAWEDVLAANLGDFYLNAHKKGKVKKPATPTAWDYVEEDPALPRVLLIGDSISRGYTVAVRQALAGKVNVLRAPANCGPTATGLAKLEVWLGSGHWDLIHVNFGIHDRKTPIAVYQANLEKILDRLGKTGARIIWASSTPIHPAATQYLPAEAIVERNAAAAEVMTRLQIPINDLFTFITPHLDATQNKGDVHFNDQGYRLLGGQVATSITSYLPSAIGK